MAATVLILLSLFAPGSLVAQAGQQGALQQVDSVLVEGNSRVATESVLTFFGIRPGSLASYRDIQTGIKSLLSQGHFSNVEVRARGGGATGITLVLALEERPLVRRITFSGLEHASERQVRDTTGLRAGFPYNPQRVLDAQAFIRSELASKGIPFAAIEERLEDVPDRPGEIDLFLDVTEGQRVTVAQVTFAGNERLEEDQLRDAMRTKAEGFWWFRSGAYDDQRFQADLEASLPALYRRHGFLDFRVVSDTLIVDPTTGKARVEVTVDEGPQYRLASFSVEGNSRFEDEDLERLFRRSEGGLLRRRGLRGGHDHRP